MIAEGVQVTRRDVDLCHVWQLIGVGEALAGRREVGQQAGQALAQDDRVVGESYARFLEVDH